MKTVLALSLLLFTSSTFAAVIGKDVSYTGGRHRDAWLSGV